MGRDVYPHGDVSSIPIRALIVMSTRVQGALLTSSIIPGQAEQSRERSGGTCLSSYADRARHRARVVVGGATNGTLSASGMIACEGRKYTWERIVAVVILLLLCISNGKVYAASFPSMRLSQTGVSCTISLALGKGLC